MQNYAVDELRKKKVKNSTRVWNFSDLSEFARAIFSHICEQLWLENFPTLVTRWNSTYNECVFFSNLRRISWILNTQSMRIDSIPRVSKDVSIIRQNKGHWLGICDNNEQRMRNFVSIDIGKIWSAKFCFVISTPILLSCGLLFAPFYGVCA